MLLGQILRTVAGQGDFDPMPLVLAVARFPARKFMETMTEQPPLHLPPRDLSWHRTSLGQTSIEMTVPSSGIQGQRAPPPARLPVWAPSRGRGLRWADPPSVCELQDQNSRGPARCTSLSTWRGESEEITGFVVGFSEGEPVHRLFEPNWRYSGGA